MLRSIVATVGLLASSSLAVAQNQCWFAAAMSLGNLPGAISMVGDVDLDGDVDAILRGTNAGSDFFEVVFNDGCQLTPGGAIPVMGGKGVPVAFVDIGGDGIRDVVVRTTSTSLPGIGPGLVIYRGLASGTFAAPVLKITWGYVHSFLEGDANGDGLPDFFSQERIGPNLVSLWYYGNANHTLTAGPTSTLPFVSNVTVGPYAHPTAVLDVDGDQIDDVVMATDTGFADQLRMFRTIAGQFTALPAVPIAPSTSTTKSLIKVDTDQDGDLDLVLSYRDGNFTGLLQIVEQLAVGSFQALPPVPLNTWGMLTSGDWDGDGDTDLVMREGGYVSSTEHDFRFLQCTAPNTYQVWPSRRANDADTFGVACVDFNGDGDLDYVQGTNIIYGDGTFGSANGGDLVTDWDGDGDLDFADGDTLYINNGGASFTALGMTFPPTPAGLMRVDWRDLGDTNGDGLREIVVYYAPGFVMRMMTEALPATFLDVGVGPPMASEPKQAVMGDFDGDGDLDLYAYERVYINDGNYGFTPGPMFGQSSRPYAVCDLDGDGDLDVVSRSFGFDSVRVAWQNGNSFTETTLSSGPGWQPTSEVFTVVADLDDDGDVDIAASFQLTGGNQEVRTFLNVGGVFGGGATLPWGGPVTAGDIDGDGLTDMCVANGAFLGVLRRNLVGPGLTYDSIQTFSMPTPTHLVDFDQDGDLDLFGQQRVMSPRFSGLAGGYRRQYGIGSIGTSGHRPIASVTDVLRPGSTASIRLNRALGGSVAFLIVGLSEANTPSVVLPGVHDYVASITAVLGLGLSGPQGLGGAGSLALPLAIPPGTFGTNWFLEFVVFDTAQPGQFTYSNGCEMFVGM